jgi:8-oxo-dGTP diphosphatase
MKNKYKNKFEVIVRAIIVESGKILVCKNKGGDYYFFPGGHVEFGEKIDLALKRELLEELGVKVKSSLFIGMVDNIFNQENELHHEIVFVFNTKIDKLKTKSREDHLEFFLLSKEEFKKAKIYPVALKNQILKNTKKIFWASQSFSKNK